MDDGTCNSEESPNDDDENENNENSFSLQTFVPSLPTRLSKDRTINNVLNRVQCDRDHENRDLIGRIMKYHQLMSLILLDI